TTFLLVPLTSRVAIGPEADFGGGINYENHTFALRISGQVTSRLSLAASFGAMTDVPGHFHPYVGFAVTRPFQ
ncbi:MAG TPA: hypothetical protein VFN77_11005, partial [Acetobacteraceae bacterium]|nr:hypothetical protein [Acetobacteraceae bacterium]